MSTTEPKDHLAPQVAAVDAARQKLVSDIDVLDQEVRLEVLFRMESIAWKVVAGIAAASMVFGFTNVLMVWGPVVLLAATIGIWMFYVQHQFEGVQWHHEEEWDFHCAALDGCSFYDLPRWLHWLTGYIGYHHVHHLSSKIPNYRLRDCHMSIPDLQRVRSLSLWESLKTVSLALWDEESRRMIRFGTSRVGHLVGPRRSHLHIGTFRPRLPAVARVGGRGDRRDADAAHRSRAPAFRDRGAIRYGCGQWYSWRALRMASASLWMESMVRSGLRSCALNWREPDFTMA